MDRVNLPLGDTGRANKRVVRITNVHFGATSEEIQKFLHGFTIIDQVRAYNPRTKTMSVVYVLFATVKEKNASLALDKQHILGRAVNIMPALTGNYDIKDDNTGFAANDEALLIRGPVAPESVDLSPLFNEDNFPTLGGKPKDFPHIPKAKSLRDRVVFLNNIPLDAKDADFTLFFDGFDVIDIQRTLHPNCNKYTPTAYAMLGSAEERTRALQLKGVKMHGQVIDVQIPKKFPHTYAGCFGVSPENSIAVAATPDEGSGYGIQKPAGHFDFEEHPAAADSAVELAHCLGRLAMGGHQSLAHNQPSRRLTPGAFQDGSAIRGCVPKGLVKAPQAVWGLFPSQLAVRHASTHTTLTSTDRPNQIVELPPLVLAPEPRNNPLSAVIDGRPPPCGLPGGINPNVLPCPENWTLPGNKTKPFFTSEEWESFENDQARRIHDSFNERDTAADRINREGGRAEVG